MFGTYSRCNSSSAQNWEDFLLTFAEARPLLLDNGPVSVESSIFTLFEDGAVNRAALTQLLTGVKMFRIMVTYKVIGGYHDLNFIMIAHDYKQLALVD